MDGPRFVNCEDGAVHTHGEKLTTSSFAEAANTTMIAAIGSGVTHGTARHRSARLQPRLEARSHRPQPARYRFLQALDASDDMGAPPGRARHLLAAQPDQAHTARRHHPAHQEGDDLAPRLLVLWPQADLLARVPSMARALPAP